MRLAYSAPLQASQPVFRHTARDTGLFVAVCDSDEVDADGCPLTPVHDRRCSVLHINNTFLLSGLVYVLCYTYTTLPTVGATRAFKYFLQSPPSISTVPITIPSHYRQSGIHRKLGVLKYTKFTFSISRNSSSTFTNSHRLSVCQNVCLCALLFETLTESAFSTSLLHSSAYRLSVRHSGFRTFTLCTYRQSVRASPILHSKTKTKTFLRSSSSPPLPLSQSTCSPASTEEKPLPPRLSQVAVPPLAPPPPSPQPPSAA
jgi:hypothetical protein